MEDKLKIKKMNIIIFNKNDDLLDKFYKNKDIILSNTKINLFDNIDYKIRKSTDLDWLFIEFESTDFNEMIQYAFNYITYNYNNKNVDGESVIIVFLKKGNNEGNMLFLNMFNENLTDFKIVSDSVKISKPMYIKMHIIIILCIFLILPSSFE